jgi:hypothetical protein
VAAGADVALAVTVADGGGSGVWVTVEVGVGAVVAGWQPARRSRPTASAIGRNRIFIFLPKKARLNNQASFL